MSYEVFKIEIEMRNAAFDDLPGEEIASILRDLALRCSAGNWAACGLLRDHNGNTVGKRSEV